MNATDIQSCCLSFNETLNAQFIISHSKNNNRGR